MSAPLTRAAATRLLAERLTGEVVVSNLGQASLDLQQIADRPLNCYTYGAMLVDRPRHRAGASGRACRLSGR